MRRNVVDLNHFLRGSNTPESSIRRRLEKQLASACLGICGRRVVQRNGAKRVSFAEPKCAEFGLTDASGIRQPRLEHRLQFSGRTRDDLQYLRGSGLLLQGLAQLVEEAGVLDGDDGLLGKIAQQLDLLVSEWPDFLAVDSNCADQVVIL